MSSDESDSPKQKPYSANKKQKPKSFAN